MKKLVLIIFLYPFIGNSQWINFKPTSAGTSGSKLVVISKNIYYYNSYNNDIGKHTLYFTNNGGKTWKYYPANPYFIFINDSTGFQKHLVRKSQYKYSDYLIRSFDYGKTWPDSFMLTPDTIGFENLTSNKQFVFITYPYNILQLTTIATEFGEKIFMISNKSLYYIHFINDTIGYGFDKKSLSIYKTINGGLNWNLINSYKGKYRWLTFQFTSEDTAYALANSNSIVKSIDGGLSWDTLDKMPDVDWIYDIEFISNNTGFALVKSSSKDFKYTTDGGKTWKRLANYVKAVTDMDILTDNDSIYFFFSSPGSGGTALFKGSFALKDILAGTQDKQPRPENKYMLYPNPAKNTLVISDKNGINTLKELLLFNLQGKKLLSEQMRSPEKSLDVSTLPKGIYFVKITDNNGVWVGKFVKE